MSAPDASNLSVDRLRALIDVSSLINSSYADIGLLFLHILKSGLQLVHCESATLLMARSSENMLYFVACQRQTGPVTHDFPVPIDSSIGGAVYKARKSMIVNDVTACSFYYKPIEEQAGFIVQKMAVVPLIVNSDCVGVMQLINKMSGDFDEDDLAVLELMCSQAAIAYKNAYAFRKANVEISLLQQAIAMGPEYHAFVSESKVMKDLLVMVAQVAKTASSVLILGESGVGKELLAEQIHLQSARSQKPFVRVNCAALPSQLLESELFGHVKGAFTDAVSERKGRFEAARGGTLFLDEVGDIPLDVQSKLLRVLQSHSFEKVGSSDTITVDTRIIAATNRDLDGMVQAGTFRSDLFYRLNVLPLSVPPLRQRREDIEPLAEFFCRKFSFETKKSFTGFTGDAVAALLAYSWPGNIRELENCVERACVLGSPPRITARDLRLPMLSPGTPAGLGVVQPPPGLDRSLKTAVNKFKKRYIAEILNETAWNKAKAVKILDIQRTYLPRLIRELDIKKN